MNIFGDAVAKCQVNTAGFTRPSGTARERCRARVESVGRERRRSRSWRTTQAAMPSPHKALVAGSGTALTAETVNKDVVEADIKRIRSELQANATGLRGKRMDNGMQDTKRRNAEASQEIELSVMDRIPRVPDARLIVRQTETVKAHLITGDGTDRYLADNVVVGISDIGSASPVDQ